MMLLLSWAAAECTKPGFPGSVPEGGSLYIAAERDTAEQRARNVRLRAPDGKLVELEAYRLGDVLRLDPSSPLTEGHYAVERRDVQYAAGRRQEYQEKAVFSSWHVAGTLEVTPHDPGPPEAASVGNHRSMLVISVPPRAAAVELEFAGGPTLATIACGPHAVVSRGSDVRMVATGDHPLHYYSGGRRLDATEIRVTTHYANESVVGAWKHLEPDPIRFTSSARIATPAQAWSEVPFEAETVPNGPETCWTYVQTRTWTELLGPGEVAELEVSSAPPIAPVRSGILFPYDQPYELRGNGEHYQVRWQENDYVLGLELVCVPWPEAPSWTEITQRNRWHPKSRHPAMR